MKATTFTIAAASLAFISSSAFAADDSHHIRLATTTSTYHSGLLDYLLPQFEKETGYQVDVIAAGTGKSLKMGENGDVDLVMTHAPKAEANFVQNGYGVLPRKLMYNDFVIVGPDADLETGGPVDRGEQPGRERVRGADGEDVAVRVGVVVQHRQDGGLAGADAEGIGFG